MKYCLSKMVVKKIIVFGFLFFPITVQAQKAVTPAITALGKPDGVKTEMQIGKEGGSFTSSDGKLRLVIPEGAVSKKTTFSIQPVTNLMPNGNGKAYQMEPSGIHFQTPLQIIFNYTDNDTEGGSSALLGIAMQDDKGQWSSVNKAVTDTITKTITAPIRHFSAYVNFQKAKIDPASARVKVNGTLLLKITNVSYDNADDELSPLGTEIIHGPVWSLNGIPNGNSTTGIIPASQDYTVNYRAPPQVPEQNPVTVTVDLITMLHDGNTGTRQLKSKITIYDAAYEVKMEAVLMGGSSASWGGLVAYMDEGSFTISLENNKPKVINIKNHLEKLRYSTCPDRVITNPTTNTGIFHVAGVRQVKLTPANPPGQPYPIVEIWFTQYPIELTRFTFNCPPPPTAKGWSKGKVDLTTGMPPPLLMFFGMPALPPYIKFIAKDEEQVIMQNPPGVEGIYYKVWVKKIRED